jgi:hypothetical protein
MNELPVAPGLVIDLGLSAVCLNRRAVVALFRDEVPIELGPCCVAVDMYGHIAYG